MKKFTLMILASLLSVCGYAQLAPEGFETPWVGSPAHPVGWTVINEFGPVYTWVQSPLNSPVALPNTGDHAAYLQREAALEGDPAPKDWLITPYFNMPPNAQLRFFSRLSFPGESNGIYKVKISTNSDPTDLASYDDLFTWTEMSLNPVQTDYYEKVLTLPAITGSVHIAFVMEGVFKDRWTIDDVKVVSQCYAPVNLTIDSAGMTSAVLNWTNQGSATSWNVEVVLDSEAPTGSGDVYTGQPPFTIPDLLPDTNYKYYVYAICDDQGQSPPVGPVFFSTAAIGENCSDPIIIPAALPYATTNNTANFADNYEGIAGTGCNTQTWENYLAGNDVVYAYTPTTNGIINVSLTNNGSGSGMFIYDSCANIGVSCLEGGTGNSDTPIIFSSFAVTANTTYYIVISTNSNSPTTAYTLTLQQVYCAAPTGLTTGLIDATSANLTWDAGTATSWQLAVQTAGTGLPLAAGQNVTQNTNLPITQTSAGVTFTPATNYEYWVRASCGDGTFSLWTGPYYFATTQIPDVIPYTQDFEGTPNGWTLNNGNQVNKWYVGTATSNTSLQSLYISNDNSITNAYSTNSSSVVHAYRDITMPSTPEQLSLSFDWKCFGENGWDFIRVWIVPSSFIPTPGVKIQDTDGVNISGDLATNSNWNTYFGVIDASTYVGEVRRIVFEWTNDSGGGSQPPAAIDNINLSIITCPAPTSPVIATNSLTDSQVTINWTPPTSSTPAGYDYYLSSDPTTPSDTATISGTATSATVTITTIEPSNSYYFWVRSNCDTNGTSTWTGPLSFIAPQVPATMDYTQNFDDLTHGWSLSNGTQVNKWVVGSATSNTASNSLYISNDDGVTNAYNINSGSVVHAYRDIQMPNDLDQVLLSFDWKNMGEMWSDYFTVWLVPISYTPTPGTQIYEWNSGGTQLNDMLIDNGTWTNFKSIINAEDYSGSIQRLVIEWRNDQWGGGTQAPAAIDNINLSVITCPQPSELEITGLDEEEATFVWTATTIPPPSYDYYLATDNIAPTETTSPSGNVLTTNAVLTDLPPDTSYSIWVRSRCSDTDQSFWIGPVNFITPQIPAAMDYTQNFDLGAHEWRLVNGTQPNKWVVGTAVNNSPANSLYISNDNGVSNAYNNGEYSTVHAYRDIEMPATLDELLLSFDWKTVGDTWGDYLRVWMVPISYNPVSGEQIYSDTDRIQIGGNFNASSAWTTSNTIIPAADYGGETRRLVFEWQNNNWDGTVPAAVDNISLSVVTCPAPSNIVMPTIPDDTATFTWTPPGSVNPTYDYYYSTASTAPNGSTTVSGNTPTATVTIEDLPQATNYFLWVRSNCGTDDHSLWIGPFEFSTPQVAVSLNYVQNFDDTTYGWTFVNNGQTNKWVVGTAVSNSPDKSLYISNDGGVNNTYNNSQNSVVHAYKDLIVPAGANELDLSFDWKNIGEGSSWSGDYIRVWRVPASFIPVAGTQITAAADREQIGGQFTANGNWSTANYILNSTGYADTTIRLVFEWRNDSWSGGTTAGAIDNIDFSIITCPKPIDLDATDVSQTGAIFEWTEVGTATAWELYIVPEGQPAPTADSEGVGADTNPYPYTVPELDPSTKYVYYVRSVCGPDDKSKWSGPHAFKTKIANDECAGAYALAVNARGEDCVVSSPAAYEGATASPEAFDCNTINGADIWYEFVAVEDRHNIELTNFSGAVTPVVIALYEGNQCGSLIQLNCSGTNVLLAQNLIPGNTYKVRIFLNQVTPDLATSFNICVNTPALPIDENQTACTITTINYSFETPSPAPSPSPSPYPSMINHNIVPGWRTTAADQIMEFWPTPNYENVPAYEGNQFIELNANLVSGIYQDYATPQSTIFNYSFAHRGRMGTDSCKLLAGPPGGPYVDVTTAITPNTEWLLYTGTHTTPASQPITRFIFQSVSTQNGDGSIGNFLDAIAFTSDNSILSVTPTSLNCIENVATVSAAGSGEWSARNDNPAPTEFENPEANTTTISGFTANGIYRFEWTTQYCSSTIEVTFDNGSVPVPVVVSTIDYCVNETTVPLTATALANHTLNWYTVATEGTASTTAPTPSATTEGVVTYYVSQVSAESCESPRAAIEVTVHALPVAPIATTAIEYCQDDAATPLTATALPGNTLNWYTVSTGGTASTTAPTPLTTQAAVGNTIYYVSQVSAETCESDRTAITVTVNPSIVPVTDFTLVSSICIADANPTAVLATGATTGGTYSATTGLVINTTTGEIDLTASTAGTYTVTYTVDPDPTVCNKGNATDATITVTPLAAAVTTFSYTSPVCVGSVNQTPTIATGFTTGGTYSSTAGLVINTATGEINTAQSTAGTYTITYNVNQSVANCTASGTNTATITITPLVTPITGFDYDDSFCFGATDATPTLITGFVSGGVFSGTTGLVINASTGLVNIADSTPGTHTVTYTIAPDPANCSTGGSSSYSFTIGGEINFTMEGMCDGSTFTITATPSEGSFVPSAVTFEWSTATGTPIGLNSEKFNVTDYVNSTPESEVFPIEIKLTVNDNGCEITKSYIVEDIACSIQKGISPNNDGMNDNFDLKFMGVKKLTIFNRYGQDVYSKGNYKDEWFGQASNGDELPTGTYYYVIERSSGSTNTGWIYINRQE